MSGLVSRLGVRLDTMGARRRMHRFKTGWPAKASPGISYYKTPKVQFRYREAGQGPAIVFTADPPMTLEVYTDLIDAFVPHFRVIVLELPAMGFSAVTENFGFGFGETNDELVLFLRAIAGEDAIFAFSCVAGLAAIDIAARHRELCSRLALIQAGDVWAFARWKARRDPRGILAKPIVGQMVMKRLAPKRMPDWYALSVGKKEMISSFCNCAETSFRHGAQWSLASAYQCYMDERVELSAPPQPIMSIWGEADRSHPAENTHTIVSVASAAHCVSFADLGHTPELEDPARVLEAILAFLKT